MLNLLSVDLKNYAIINNKDSLTNPAIYGGD